MITRDQIEERLEEILPTVSKPGRYTGAELNMLDLGGIPVRSLDRDSGKPDGSHWPIIFAGGHCTFNPEPMAPFIDLFVIGESEEVLPGLIETFKANRHLTREELLLKIAN